MNWIYIITIVFILYIVYERIFCKHILVSNFPVIAWGRYIFEMLGKPFRQYWFMNDREEKPFNRKERSYVYQSAKQVNRNQGFGSDDDWEAINHFNILQSNFPFISEPNIRPKDYLPCAKVIGPQRQRPFFLDSIVNVSAISFGSQGERATKIMNMGCAISGAYHNTGEGGFTQYHKVGASVVWQLGTGYFGARNSDGTLNINKVVEVAKKNKEIRAIEIKISQGAKPGKGGILAGKKVTQEIADIRGIPVGEDCISPSYHTAFKNNEELINLCEEIAEKTGLPVGIKSAVGKLSEWKDLFRQMSLKEKGPDYIQIDGAEGGTGSAPPHYADHVARPLEQAFALVYKLFQESECNKQVVWMASGRLSSPSMAIKLLAMGADSILVARPAMMAMGCLQTQHCHKNNCPVGIQTHKRWLQMGLNSGYAASRVSNYLKTLRKDILDITHSCGYEHPCQFTMEDVEKNSWTNDGRKNLKSIYFYEKSKVEFESMTSLSEKQKQLSKLKNPNLTRFSIKESKWNYFFKRVIKKAA